MITDDKEIRILQILPGGHVCGGIEMFVMNYYRELVKYGIKFDFLVHYKEKGYFDDEIKKLGGKIYYLSVREDKNIFRYFWQLFKFFSMHKEYKIIHGHMPGMAPIYFSVAKLLGVKYRISHAHVTETEKTFKGKVLKYIIKNIHYFSNIYFACSKAAGDFMYGNLKYDVIRNAIHTSKFLFNQNKREVLRKKLGLDGKYVIGHIGRFNLQKNHDFLIEIFYRVSKINDNAVLLLIGEGPLENHIKEKAIKLGLQEKILFLGVRNDVADLYNVMDIFVLPSLFEGLGIVSIEAQFSGLMCILSDKVPIEAQITQLVHFCPLSNLDGWVKLILQQKNNIYSREKVIFSSDYNILNEAKKLASIYSNLLDKRDK